MVITLSCDLDDTEDMLSRVDEASTPSSSQGPGVGNTRNLFASISNDTGETRLPPLSN